MQRRLLRIATMTPCCFRVRLQDYTDRQRPIRRQLRLPLTRTAGDSEHRMASLGDRAQCNLGGRSEQGPEPRHLLPNPFRRTAVKRTYPSLTIEALENRT